MAQGRLGHRRCLPLRTDHPRLHGLRDRRGGSGTAHRGRVHLSRALGRGGVLRCLQGPRELALLRDTPARLGRAGCSRQAAGPQLRPVPHGRLGAGLVGARRRHRPEGRLGPAVPRHDRRVAAGRGRARLAGGQEHPGHPHVRQPGYLGAARARAQARGKRAPSPGGPAGRPRPPASGRRPRRSPTPSTPPATIRAAPPARARRSRSRTRWPNSTR